MTNKTLPRHEAIVSIMKDFDKVVYKFKAGAKEKVPFSFVYNGPMKIQSIKMGCGCTNGKLDGNKISGIISIDDNNSTYSKHITAYFSDGLPYYTEDKSNNMIPSTKLSVSLTLTRTRR